MASICESRVVYYPAAMGDPENIPEAYLATQVCPTIPLSEQTVWFDPSSNNIYFILPAIAGEPVIGSPTLLRKILIDSYSAILRDDSDAELYTEVIV
jgi:hypothetical protein